MPACGVEDHDDGLEGLGDKPDHEELEGVDNGLFKASWRRHLGRAARHRFYHEAAHPRVCV